MKREAILKRLIALESASLEAHEKELADIQKTKQNGNNKAPKENKYIGKIYRDVLRHRA